jgi:signal transduction histidine kinase
MRPAAVLLYRAGVGSDGRWGAYAPDVARAVGVAALVVVGVRLASPDPGAAAYVLPLIAAGALVARRRAPVAVLIVTTACVTGYQLLGFPGAVPAVPSLVAIYTAVSARHRLITTLITLAALILTALVLSADQPARAVLEDRFLLAGWLVASGVMGEVARQRHAYVDAVERRAADAERSREETARRRAGEERLRIARELHDSLTHSISVIKVQTDVAIHLARKRGQDVPDALVAIQEASHDASRELRATLDVLRENGVEPPASRLDRLPDLVARVHASGLPVTLTVTGEQRALPADIEGAVYRIVQEALTNVTRHAGPAAATVKVEYGPQALTVQVDDDGQATPDAVPAPGGGLTGMRERVAALDGRLRVEPRREGGFTVRAELPVPDAS